MCRQLRREENVDRQLDDIAAETTETTDVKAARAVAHARQRALLGYAKVFLTDKKTWNWAWGAINDRPLVEAKAKQLADGFKSGIRRFDHTTMLECATWAAEITPKGATLLADSLKLSISELLTGDKLPNLVDIMSPDQRTLKPLSGQHRQKAMEIYLDDHVRGELSKLATELVTSQQIMSTLEEGTRKQGMRKTMQIASRRVAEYKGELEVGSVWMVAIYKHGALPPFIY